MSNNCYKCGIELTEITGIFRKDSGKLKGICRECNRLAAQVWRKNNKKQALEYKLQKHYHLSTQEYEQLLKEQSFVCAICKKACATNERLSVDHSHVTQEVRGLLCSKCNMAIGLLNDSRTTINSALDYLRTAKETSMIGIKYDSQKPATQYIPPHAILEVAKVMSFGASKYGAHNYLQGMEHTRLAAAALRHIFQYLGGEDKDCETGLEHLAHAAASILMVLEYRTQDIGSEDRFYKPKEEEQTQ